MNTKYFKTGNKIICVGFTENTKGYIFKNLHNGLRVIHVFVTEEYFVDKKPLVEVANYCKENRVMLILHCFGKDLRHRLKRFLKGEEKGKYFRIALNCSKKDYEFAYSNGAYLNITHKNYSGSIRVSRSYII